MREEARHVVAGRIRHDLGEVLEDPRLRALRLLEPREPGEVVVVVVARDHDIDRAKASDRLQVVERVLDETEVRRHVVPAREAVVQQEGPAVVGHERVAIGHRVWIGPEVGKDLRLRLVHRVRPYRPDPVLPHLALQAVQEAELRLEETERRGRVVGRVTVRRAEPLERESGEQRDRVKRRAGRVGQAVLPLEVVDRVDVTGLGDEVAAEGRRQPVDLGDEGDRALGVTRGRQHPDVVLAPAERLVVAQRPRDRDRPGQGEPDAGDVVVVVDALEPPERVGLGEERCLPLGYRDRDAPCGQEMVPLALIAVMVRVQHPLDLADSRLPEVLEDAARAEVDQESAVTPDQEVDVAGIAVPVEARRQAHERARSAHAMGVGMPVAAVAVAVAGVVVRAHAEPPVGCVYGGRVFSEPPAREPRRG